MSSFFKAMFSANESQEQGKNPQVRRNAPPAQPHPPAASAANSMFDGLAVKPAASAASSSESSSNMFQYVLQFLDWTDLSKSHVVLE